MTGWLTRHGPYVVGAVLIAGLVHIAIILIIPRFSESNAVARLGAAGKANQLEALPTIGAGAASPFPYDDPALVTAVCRFDISEQPLRLRVSASESFLSVLFMSSSGRVLASLTDRAATRRQLNIVLLTAEQQRQLEAQDPDDEPVQDLRLRIGETRGVALVRTLALRESDRAPFAAALARAGCAPD